MPSDGYNSDLSADFLSQLQLLRTKYCDSLRKKELELEDIIANIVAYGSDRQILTDLHFIVHQLAGAAPTHGFHDVARHASGIEKKVAEVIKVTDLDVIHIDVLLDVEDLTQEIRTSLETFRLA